MSLVDLLNIKMFLKLEMVLGFFFSMNYQMIIVFGVCHGWLGKMSVG